MGGNDLVREIAARVLRSEPLGTEEIEHLLGLSDPKDIEVLCQTAVQIREEFFGRKIYLYGFLYFSTYCRNNCSFCYYRRDNRRSPRYRKNAADILDIGGELARSGVHLIDITMGEDPLIHNTGNFDPLLEVIDQLKMETGLPLMISPGVVSADILYQMKARGVDWYACYQETHNPGLFKQLRLEQSFAERVKARERAKLLGMMVEDGLLLGAGESLADTASALLAMRDGGANQVRVMSLVPQADTPLSNYPPPIPLRELVTIAVMRLTMPDRFIPASLDIEGIEGLEGRLKAGANVVTSIVLPGKGLAGVSQATLDIEQGNRTVGVVSPWLKKIGLQVGSQTEYNEYLQRMSAVKGENP